MWGWGMSVEVSKFLSYVLRHQPESIGLVLDNEGWAEIDALIAGAAQAGRQLDRAIIAAVVAGSDKKRFALSADGARIRAVQGHSTESVAIAYAEKVPPDLLYHGTATRFMNSIRAQGLLPGSRHHVHLSADAETAVKVGQRHGKPQVLVVAAGEMHRQGHKFFQAENGVWLTADVPAIFLSE
jgi:putative RNA 2'-phosphotransferase